MSMDRVDAMLTEELACVDRRVRALVDWCESPIERMMLLAIARIDGFAWSIWSDYPNLQNGAAVATLWGLCVYAQHDVTCARKRYRLDFAIVDKDVKVAIECDGHDFHERTKKQAEHDKSRDRALVTAGWKVLRFTGSEVWADPARCVRQIQRVVWPSLLLFDELDAREQTGTE